MKAIFNKSFLSIPLILLFFLSCTVEDAIEQLVDEGDFTAKVNGDNFSAEKAAIAVKINTNINQSGLYSIAMIAGDIVSTEKAKVIGLVMVGPDFNQLSAGKIFEEISENDTEGGGAGYSEDLGSNNDDIETDIIESVFIKITSIDKDEKLISGEFNFVAIDEDKNKKYTVTNGQFTNIPYQIE